MRATRITLGSESFVLLSLPRAPAPGLTDAERQVALALVAGRSNEAIAAMRGTSVRTVANQVAALFRKLGVGSRTELAARWAGLMGEE